VTKPADVLQPGQILQRAAKKLSISIEEVEHALAAANITLDSSAPSDRALTVLRLRAHGVKHSGELFAVKQTFSSGVWAIVHPDNSAGKTSMLEFLVWPLRGHTRDLPPDVRSWLRQLSLDLVVAGRPSRITLTIDPTHSAALSCEIHTAESTEQLLQADVDTHSLRLLDHAEGEVEVSRKIGAFFLHSLRMERTSLWRDNGGQDGEGAPQIHGWASYFGACYLNPGGEKILFGDVNAVGLPARLMDLFVSIPYSTVLTQLSVVAKQEKKLLSQERRRAEGDSVARATQRADWLKEREHLSESIAETRAATEQDVAAVLNVANVASAGLRDQQLIVEEAAGTLVDAHTGRVRAEQALLDATETWQARRVLGRLDPVCCPRCEEPLDHDRHQLEKDDASCAVCSRPLPAVDEETAELMIEGLEQQLNELRKGEVEARTLRDEAAATAAERLVEQREAVSRLNQVLSTSRNHDELRRLELKQAELDGRLAATAMPPAEPAAPLATRIVDTVTEIIRESVTDAAHQIFPLLDQQIVELATRFGVQNLDSVKLDRAGRVNAVKAKVKTNFGNLSRGDRLRMRIATAIALLRVGAARHVATHPGLLLIDSVAAEEVTADSARTLIAELQSVAAELPGLQIVLTTAQPELVIDLPDHHVITSDGDHLF
jgi:hypothetical protein